MGWRSENENLLGKNQRNGRKRDSPNTDTGGPSINCHSSNLSSEIYVPRKLPTSIRDKTEKGTTKKMSKTTSSTDLLFDAYLEKREALDGKISQLQEQLKKLDDAARTLGLFGHDPEKTNTPACGKRKEQPKIVTLPKEKPTFVQTVLDVIYNAPFGSHLTTGEVQAQAEKRLGQKFAKATGSTALTRLAKEGAITRVARNQWRAAK